MSDTYKKFKEMLQSVDAKKEDLEERFANLEEELAETKKELKAAEISGSDDAVEAVQSQLEKLQKELNTVRERLKFYNSPREERINLLVELSPDVKALAESICVENTIVIGELQDEYDAAQIEMQEFKLKYLAQLVEMGNIYRESKELAGENIEVNRIMHGKIPKGTGFKPIKSDVYDDPLHVSEIFVNPVQTQRAFNGEEYLSIRKERII